MEIATIKIGSPYIFNSGIYGKTAVHVTAIYNGIVHFSIDGGEAAKQVREFPELSDGTYFAIPERIERRAKQATPTQVAKAAETAMNAPRNYRGRTGEIRRQAEIGKTPERVLAEKAGIVNTIREVPGVGKVAIITDDRPKTTAQRNKRRLSLTAALNLARTMADRNPTHFKWEKNTEVETF